MSANSLRPLGQITACVVLRRRWIVTYHLFDTPMYTARRVVLMRPHPHRVPGNPSCRRCSDRHRSIARHQSVECGWRRSRPRQVHIEHHADATRHVRRLAADGHRLERRRRGRHRKRSRQRLDPDPPRSQPCRPEGRTGHADRGRYRWICALDLEITSLKDQLKSLRSTRRSTRLRSAWCRPHHRGRQRGLHPDTATYPSPVRARGSRLGVGHDTFGDRPGRSSHQG